MNKIISITILAVVLCVPWAWNAVKFFSCDFESDYKCELIHGAGLVLAPLSYVTVWFAADGQ